MIQLLCPYTTNLLTETNNVNDEHILPVALGAPKSFYVRATEEENSRMNELIDSPASNDPLLRFIAMAAGVKGRSGTVCSEVNGKIEGSGESVQASFSSDKIDLKFIKPVDIENGEIKGVRGFGEQAVKQANTIKKNSEKKGKIIEIGEVQIQQSPWIHMSIVGDLHIIRAELIKTAYLMSVRVFGDVAIDSDSGAIFRAAMLAPNTEAIIETGIIGSSLNNLPPPFETPVEKHEHLIFSIHIGKQIYTGVQLFGTFSAFFLTPTSGFTCEFGTGEIVKINAATSSMTSKTLVEFSYEFAQNGR
ncbi:hypothetical protein [Janthinobacterium sp. BJB426]|uniref:hypothetical protein n=1 Tax=Janthinobacterium sp. BJB426 TaxID=2048010 RepID=UPI00130538EC|nr:hypothetical protein [Janthinobacterium sp. BJB426]